MTSLEEELVAAQADAGQLDVVRSQLAEAEKRSEELSAEAERLETENAALRLQMEAAEVAASKSEEQVQHLLCRVRPPVEGG